MYDTIPKYKIDIQYNYYISSFWLSKCNRIQREIGVENHANGLTPDVVRNNPDWKSYYVKSKEQLNLARNLVPNTKELRKITNAYHKIYDMGQRIKINKLFGEIERSLINEQKIIERDEYVEIVKNKFQTFNFEN